MLFNVWSNCRVKANVFAPNGTIWLRSQVEATGAFIARDVEIGTAVTLILDGSSNRFLISSLTFIMALLVAQTRVETGVHSVSEVASGAAVGTLVTLFLFQTVG